MSLTLERIFGDPDLNGPAPIQLKLSSNGRQVSYLKAAEDNFEQLNLWIYDINAGEHRLLVDATELTSQRVLSDAEKARRERLRITQSGIVEYYWTPSGDALLFPIEGNLFLYQPDEAQPLTQLTDDSTFETDIRFSPNGKCIAFVREQNLFVMDLATKDTRQLTTEGGGLISCGLAEFIAQEEMHRYSGYWWSPDSTQIAFTRTDESPIEVSQRYEIDADHFGVFDQRYPFAGKPNADVKVGVVQLKDQSIQWIDTETANETYLARVHWFKDSQHLAIERQSRNQQELELLRAEVKTGKTERLLTETSNTWINLNDNFTALDDQQFIWGSERSGFNHLYLYQNDGTLVKPLTAGDWVVSSVKAVTHERLFFSGYRDTPIEHHLYAVDLNSDQITRVTRPGASHTVTLSPDGKVFVDRYSAALTPPAVDLCRMVQSTTATTETQKDDSATKAEVIEQLEENSLDQSHPFAPFKSNRGEVNFGQITANDGQTLHYRTIKPSSNRLEINGASPLILTVYGGPGVQRVNNEWIPPWHHYMAAQGYGLLQLDNRGTANRGTAFEAPIYGRLGEVEVEDQLAGIDNLASLGWVDRNRLGVFGHSYGGYMTLMLLMNSDYFKAGVSVAPVTDWHLYDTHYTERFLGHPAENQEGYAASAVFPYASNLTGKVLIIHGMADDNVLFTNSTKLYKTLQDLNIDFEIMNYPGAKHGLSGRSINIHRYSMMDRFFAQNLQ